MTSTPDDPFKELDDPAKAKDFIQSVTGGTPEIARMRVKSELYLAHKTKAAGETLATALKSLADALERGARASEQYARRLVWATWALVLATLGLVLVTALQVWRGN